MQTGHDTATEITRDIIVAMLGSGSLGCNAHSAEKVAEAFEIVYAKVEEKWRAE
jgi:hypothetical protein